MLIKAVILIAIMVYAFLLFLKPKIGLLAIIITLPIMVGFSENIGASEQIFIVFFGIWYMGWIIYLLIDRSESMDFIHHPVTKPTLAVNALIFMSVIIGLLNGASLIDTFRDFSRYIGYFIIFPTLSLVRNRKTAWQTLIFILIIGFPFYIWASFIWRARKFGLEYGMLNTAEIGSAYFGPFIGALWPSTLLDTGKRIRMFAILGIFLLLLYAIGSGYRHRIIGIIVMTGVVIWSLWTIQSGRQKIVAVIPLLIGVLFVFWVFSGTLGNLPLPGGEKTRRFYNSLIKPGLLLQDRSVQGRITEANAAFNEFRKHPIIGKGLGHRVEMKWKGGDWYKQSFGQHIWVTETLMKFGAVGLIIFVWYFISILRYVFATAQKVRVPVIKAFALGIFAWIITNLVPTIGSISNRGFTFIVGIMIGILPALAGYTFNESNDKNEKE